MTDRGQMTENDVLLCYKSWRGTVVREHNACRKTLDNLDALYKSLFPVHEEAERKGRNALFAESFKEAEKEDLYHIV
jgi:hypothetical protein